jgi:hypothetical protein
MTTKIIQRYESGYVIINNIITINIARAMARESRE